MRRLLVSGMAATALLCPTIVMANDAAIEPVSSLTGGTLAGQQNLPAPMTPGLEPFGTGSNATSFNWSGYAQVEKKKTFTGVTATFDVTTVNTTGGGTQYSADWVGIGGFSKKSKDLVQAGVEEDNNNGTPFYQAWTEILPAGSNPFLTLTISAGDTVTVTVRESALNKWTMTVADVTASTSASRTVTYKSKGLSVEAIHERPCIIDSCKTVSDLATLATTTNETFDPGQFTSSKPGPSATYSALLTPASKATLYDIVMLANDGTTHIATPSPVDSDSDGFTVADGSTAPPPPSS